MTCLCILWSASDERHTGWQLCITFGKPACQFSAFLFKESHYGTPKRKLKPLNVTLSVVPIMYCCRAIADSERRHAAATGKNDPPGDRSGF